MHAFANKKFNDTGYRLITGSALYAYVSHYFFIILVAVLIIRPYKLTLLQGLALELFLVNATILISYLLFTLIYDLFVPKKEEEVTVEGTLEERETLLKKQEVGVAAKTR